VRWLREQRMVVGEGIEIAPTTRQGRVCLPESPVYLHGPSSFQAITRIAAEIACPVVTHRHSGGTRIEARYEWKPKR
jgi:hypothetical protein